MSRRNWISLSALSLVFAFSQVAAAQVNPTLAAPQNGKAAAVAPADAPAPGDATWNDVLRELQLLRSEVQTIQSNVSGLQQNVQAIQDGFAKQLDFNDKIQKQVDELSHRVESIIVGGSGGNGGGTNFVRSIQDDPKLAGDFQKVIQGKIIFDNQTGQPQRIFVNGAEWEVIVGRSSMLVPYGRVTFHTRVTNDGSLTQFNLDNWTTQGDQFVLNVPLQISPTAVNQ